MIQWICGRLEASYVGERSKLVLPRADSHERRYQLRVFRAAVRDVKAILPPPDARPPVIDPPVEGLPPVGELVELAPATFRQARVEEAHVKDVRGRGSSYVGALFDVRVSAVELSYPAEKSGRAYGRMTGTVVACLVLPPEPLPQRVPATVLIEEPPAPRGELHVPVAEAPADNEGAPPDALPAASAHAAPRLLPWLLLSALVCLALALTRGALPAVLWALFMLPTVVARRMLSGVLPDTRGMHIVGAALVALQLVCTSVLLQRQWSADCGALSMLPLLGVVAALFPAGLMPSSLPLLCNAVGLALVLFGECG